MFSDVSAWKRKTRKKVLNRWRFFSIEFVYDFSSFQSPWGGLEIVMNFEAISLIPLGSSRSTKTEQKEPPMVAFTKASISQLYVRSESKISVFSFCEFNKHCRNVYFMAANCCFCMLLRFTIFYCQFVAQKTNTNFSARPNHDIARVGWKVENVAVTRRRLRDMGLEYYLLAFLLILIKIEIFFGI